MEASRNPTPRRSQQPGSSLLAENATRRLTQAKVYLLLLGMNLGRFIGALQRCRMVLWRKNEGQAGICTFRHLPILDGGSITTMYK